jgi:hypothetical protein
MIKNLVKIDEKNLDEFVQDAKDACFFAGLAYFCSNNKNDVDFDDATFLSFTLLPSPFPRQDFEFAVEIQTHWNKLIHCVSNDYEFLYSSLKR